LGVWCCPFFQGGWFSFVCIWASRHVFQRSLVFCLWLLFLFYPVLCIFIDKRLKCKNCVWFFQHSPEINTYK
jgi:hypothetical protein